MRHAPATLALLAAASFLSPPPVGAVLPLGTYPECGVDETVEDCPVDLRRSDGTWTGNTWEIVGFTPADMKRQVRREEEPLGLGNGVDKAWRYSTGRFDTVIAVIDSGIVWRNWGVRNKVSLNKAELSAPRNATGATCPAWDCDGNGLLTLVDYAADARVLITAGDPEGDTYLDASDLIATFSNGVDEDQNGYVDDIAGWDFLWDDNNPWASNDFDHGTGVMEQAAAEGGEMDSDIGVCPNCAILPVRGGDSFIADADRLAMGILYATDRGAAVIAMASGTVNNTANLHRALEYAWERGVFVVAAIGDELSYHHLYPGASDYLMAVHSIRYWPPTHWEQGRSFLAYNGCNNYGSHLTVVAGTAACATGATAITAGAAGLLISQARDLGLTLHPDEVRALLTNAATDIALPVSGGHTPWFPSRPGWDLFFGYGRVNVGAAAEMIAEDLIPPRVQITSPSWFSFKDASQTPTLEIHAALAAPRAQFYDWTLEWAPGGQPRDGDFALLATGTNTSAASGLLYRWDTSRIPASRFDASAPLEQILADQSVPEKFDAVNIHAITLRLAATDSRGRRAEMRKSFFLHQDPDLLPGFPIELGSSGEASPFLADLDDDGVLDVLVASADGVLHAINGEGGELPGWPVEMPTTAATTVGAPGNHLGSAAFEAGVERPRDGVMSGMVASDIDGDGGLEVVAATMAGEVWVFQADGTVRPGFPVARDPVSEADTDPMTWYDPGIMATPLVIDLDGDGALEIVVPGMDQQVYVWREDGARQPGWPVILEQESSDRHIKGRIVSSPAPADLDGDGQVDIVVGSNEWDPELLVPGYTYGVSGLGNLDPRGPMIRGWPVMVPGALNGLVPWIGEGVPATAAVEDVDGDGEPEIIVSGVVSCPHRYEANGRRTVQYACNAPAWNQAPTQEMGAIAFVSTPLLADVDEDGDMELMVAMSGLDYGLSMLASTWLEHQDHLLGMWDADTGDPVIGWPVVMEDVGFFMRPTVADVDGDGRLDIVASTGGQVVHAYDQEGLDVPFWPKATGGWVVSALAAGDIDGDRTSEVVAMTREGYLFAWKTDGRKLAAQQGQPWTGWMPPGGRAVAGAEGGLGEGRARVVHARR